jgi:hypothetical protein
MYTEQQLAEQARTRRYTTSKYLPGPDFDVAAIVDEGGDESLQSVLFIYGQSLLRAGTCPLVSALVPARWQTC